MGNLKMLVAFVIVVLGLLNHSESTPPNCQQLLRPFDLVLPQDLEGQWALVAGGLNGTSALERFKMRDSAVINWAAINGSSMHFSRHDGFNESCRFIDFVITLEGSGFRLGKLNMSIIFMHTTCPDCLVIHFEKEDKSPVPLYLISRRREVDKAEMEEFKEQVKCLEMHHLEVMDPTKKLCQKGPTTPADPVEG